MNESADTSGPRCKGCGECCAEALDILNHPYCLKCGYRRIRHAKLARTILVSLGVLILVPNVVGSILLISDGRWEEFDWKYVVNAGFLVAIFYHLLKSVWPVARMKYPTAEKRQDKA